MLQRSVLRLLLTGSKSVLGSALAPAASTANSEPPKSLSSSLVLSCCSFSSEALPAASQHGDRHIQQATDPGASSAGPVNDAAQAIDKDQGPVVIQDGPEVERFPFVPPHLRQQQPLHVDDAKLVWQYAQRMHGAGRLSQVRVGAAGLTRALLRHIMQLLQRNEVVRVRLRLLGMCPYPQHIALLFMLGCADVLAYSKCLAA